MDGKTRGERKKLMRKFNLILCLIYNFFGRDSLCSGNVQSNGTRVQLRFYIIDFMFGFSQFPGIFITSISLYGGFLRASLVSDELAMKQFSHLKLRLCSCVQIGLRKHFASLLRFSTHDPPAANAFVIKQLSAFRQEHL